MKKMKLSIQRIENAEVLSRAELKTILGGDGSGETGSGECQAKGEKCDTGAAKNCCNDLVCGEFICRTATL